MKKDEKNKRSKKDSADKSGDGITLGAVLAEMREEIKHLPKLRLRRAETLEESSVYLLIPFLVFVTAMVSAAGAGMLYILIAGSDVHWAPVLFSTAVLCMLAAFTVKALTGLIGYSDRALLTVLTVLGYIAAIPAVAAYYISHDYEMSVYRYMKVTPADVYYYGGYDELEADYASPEEFMQAMQDSPASIVLDSMSIEKLGRLTPEQLETIRSENLWDYFGFSEILGTSSDEVEDSLTASRTMNAYEFTFEYRGLTAKTFSYMLTRPEVMPSELEYIIYAGSHSIGLTELLFFLGGELFCVYMLCMHFGVNEKRHIVYFTRPAPPMRLIAFFRLLTGSVGEMFSSWRFKDMY